jgi:hypothetical protein
VKLLVVLLVVTGGSAAADPMLTPITSRNYSIDIYDGVPLGNTAVIAMGGASVANANGSSGTLVNPSAPAIRASTDHDRWSIDTHLDYLHATAASDFSNSGLPYSPDSGATRVTGGFALRIKNWGAAYTVSWQSLTLAGAVATLPDGSTSPIDASATRQQLALAHWYPSIDLAVGAAVSVATLNIQPTCNNCGSLFSIEGVGFEVGAQYIPQMESFRIGVSGATPIAGGTVSAGACDPNNCDGLILPDEVHVPWRVAVGGAYRFGPTEWNQDVPGRWRDEEAVTLVADLVVTGSSPNAYGLDAFGQNELERSGSHVAWSVRAGSEYEWLPGRLRVRAGGYWEPGRFDGVSGRLHATFGAELRVFEFWLFGRRRGRITGTGDLASHYQNFGVSIGFWH